MSYFNGVSAQAKSAWVHVKDGGLSINVEGNVVNYTFAEINLQARLGSSNRIIDLPDGARLEATDIGELETVLPSKANIFWHLVHYLENHLGWVMVSLVVTVWFGWIFLQHGVPKLAEYVADATPLSMELELGEQVLKGMDHKYGYFSPSKTKKIQQTNIASELKRLCVSLKTCPKYQLNFREGGPIGANAIALPGGIIIVTDELVELARNDTEVVAVLAHELGHVKQRHAFRQSIQGTLSGLVLAAATGDVSSVGSGLPAALMQMRYSRQHELEADDFALIALQRSCLPPRAFANILYRLQNQHQGTGDKKGENKTKGERPRETYEPVNDMLSTHPNTLERIKPFVAAKRQC